MARDICPVCHIEYCETSICSKCALKAYYNGEFPLDPIDGLYSTTLMEQNIVPIKFIEAIFMVDSEPWAHLKDVLTDAKLSEDYPEGYSEFFHTSAGGNKFVACRLKGKWPEDNRTFDILMFYIDYSD